VSTRAERSRAELRRHAPIPPAVHEEIRGEETDEKRDARVDARGDRVGRREEAARDDGDEAGTRPRRRAAPADAD
jgi:hypothetical protein